MNENYSLSSAKHIMKWKLKNIPYAYSSYNVPIYKDCWVDKDGEFKYLKEAWRPLENANQLMIIIEKMKEHIEGFALSIHYNHFWDFPDKWVVDVYRKMTDCITAGHNNKSKNIAVIEACLEAIEAKGVEV